MITRDLALHRIGYACLDDEEEELSAAGIDTCAELVQFARDAEARTAAAAITGLEADRLTLLAVAARCELLSVPGGVWIREQCRKTPHQFTRPLGTPAIKRTYERLLVMPEADMADFIVDSWARMPGRERLLNSRRVLFTYLWLAPCLSLVYFCYSIPSLLAAGRVPAGLVAEAAARWRVDAWSAAAVLGGLALLIGLAVLACGLLDTALVAVLRWLVRPALPVTVRAARLDFEANLRLENPGLANFAAQAWLPLFAIGLGFQLTPAFGWRISALVVTLAAAGLVAAQQSAPLFAAGRLADRDRRWVLAAREAITRVVSLEILLRATLLLVIFRYVVPLSFEQAAAWAHSGPPAAAIAARAATFPGERADQALPPDQPDNMLAAPRTGGQQLAANAAALATAMGEVWSELRGEPVSPHSLVKIGAALIMLILFLAVRWKAGLAALAAWLVANTALTLFPLWADRFIETAPIFQNWAGDAILLLLSLGTTIVIDQVIVHVQMAHQPTCAVCGWRAAPGEADCEACGAEFI